jgi:NADH:ubiquinone oxidoreductase subunit E
MNRFRSMTDLEERGRALVAACPAPAGALHPLVDLVLAEGGVWDNESARWVAGLTGVPLAAVNGITSSRLGPADDGDGEVVKVCTGLSCRWMGADVACERLARLPGIRVVKVDCLGACAAGPVMSRDGRLHDGLTPERLEALVAGDR